MPSSAPDAAQQFALLFGQLYLHLHPRRGPVDYRPTRESLAVLRHLAVSGPLTVKAAAAHFSRSQSAMSEMIERLIGRDLLARIQDDADRRQHLVWLTDEGQRVVSEESEPLDLATVRRVLADVAPDDLAALLRGLEAVAIAAASYAQAERRPKP